MRQAERALHDAEALVALLPAAEWEAFAGPLHDAWEKTLHSQFHDVAAGAGIRRVHAEAVFWLEEAVRIAWSIIDQLVPAQYGLGGADWEIPVLL